MNANAIADADPLAELRQRELLDILTKIVAFRNAEDVRITKELTSLYKKLDDVWQIYGEYENGENGEYEMEILRIMTEIKALIEERREYGTLRIRQEIGEIRCRMIFA